MLVIFDGDRSFQDSDRQLQQFLFLIEHATKKGRRAKPRNGFYIFSCGAFELNLL